MSFRCRPSELRLRFHRPDESNGSDNGRTTPAGSDILGVMQAVVSPVLAYIGPGAGFTFLSSFFVLFTAIALLFLSLVTWPIHFVLQWFHRLRAGVRSGVKRVVVVGLDPQHAV